MDLPKYAKVIVNPYAGTGATGRKWSKIEVTLHEAGLEYDVVRTEGQGHAQELAEDAALNGYRLIVAVGGDGTINEVVNGLMLSGLNREVILGILNTGTGCDFARFLEIPRDFRLACIRLVNPQQVKVDVGAVDCYRDGEPVRRYFISTASLGFDGEVVETAQKRPRILHGNTSYFMGILEILRTYHNKDIRLTLDELTEEMRICSMVIANAGSYASGMRIVPEADLSDGLFEVLIVGDINKFDLIQSLPRAYLGIPLNHPKISMEKASSVTIESDQRVLIQADGELLGEAPARFEIIPSALNIAL